MAVAVDQHDPAAAVGGVTLLCLGEDLGDHLLAGGGDRPDKPLGAGEGPLRCGRPPPPSAALPAAVAAVLDDPAYRAGARRIAAEIAALPTADQVAGRLTQPA